MDTPSPGLRRDALLALALAVALGVAWTVRDWANLSALRLPDTDDVMRLQQVRDWLDGQAWNDLVQHRLGAAGGAMHWTRLADLGPRTLIAALAPLLGRHGAEVAAVVAWPIALFALAIRSSPASPATSAARRSPPPPRWSPPSPIPPPASSCPADRPSRAADGAAARRRAGARAAASEGAGFAAGLLAAAGLVVGLETAPLIAALGAVASASGWRAASTAACAASASAR